MDIKPSTVSSNLASCAGNPFSCLLIGAFSVIVGYPAGQCPVPHCLLRLHSLTSHFASHRSPALGRSRTTTAWTLWLRHFREYVSWEMYTRVLLDSVQLFRQQYCTVSTLFFAVILVKTKMLMAVLRVGLLEVWTDRKAFLAWSVRPLLSYFYIDMFLLLCYTFRVTVVGFTTEIKISWKFAKTPKVDPWWLILL